MAKQTEYEFLQELKEFLNAGASVNDAKTMINHRQKVVKNCSIPDVSQQRELLTEFMSKIKDVAPYFIQHKPNELVEDFIKRRK